MNAATIRSRGEVAIELAPDLAPRCGEPETDLDRDLRAITQLLDR
jgi:hypothetical protein